MSSSAERQSNPTAWAAFWFALAGLLLMPIPLFIGLIQSILRPHKVIHPCHACGLRRHDPDAVHCKACGVLLNIPDDGV